MVLKRYIVSLEVIMYDDENQSQFENLNLGCLDDAQKNDQIESWDYRDTDSIQNVSRNEGA